MQATLVTLGAVAVVAAIVGGGLKAFGIEIPLVGSLPRQVLLGLFGLALIGGGLLEPWNPTQTKGEDEVEATELETEATELATERVDLLVPATQAWTPTAVHLEAGDQLEISAAGLIRDDVNNHPTRRFGPDGVADPEGQHPGDPFVGEGFAHAMLVGRIGEAGEAFPVGSALRCRAATAGRLFVGINDGLFDDNDGEYEITVIVIKAASVSPASLMPCLQG